MDEQGDTVPESNSRPVFRDVVPRAPFIEDVKDFIGVRQPDDVLRDLKDSQQKYKYMETQLVKKKASLFMREPEIKKCLEALKLLKSRKGEDSTHLNFGLADQVYARAKLSQDVDSVHLWLGAGIMVEYPLHEAEDLLEAQLDVCQKQLLSCEADYNYIRDQITTTEVSIARVYNYEVAARRK